MSDSFLLPPFNLFCKLSCSLVAQLLTRVVALLLTPALPPRPGIPLIKGHSVCFRSGKKHRLSSLSSYPLQIYCFLLASRVMSWLSFLLRKNTTWMEQYCLNVKGQMRDPSTISLFKYPESSQKRPIISHYVLLMLTTQRRQHKEGEMLGNLDLLGVTWSFVPVPKISFWLTPNSHCNAGLYKMASFLSPFSFGQHSSHCTSVEERVVFTHACGYRST